MPRKMLVKSSTDVAKKWADVTPGRSTFYESEASKAGSEWESGATGAAGAFKSAVAAGDIGTRYSGGVKKAGGAKYERKIKDVGVSRFGPGVSAAQADMQSGVDPYLAIIAATEIPDRGPRGSASNWAIPQKVGDPLHKKRLALLGATGAS